MTDPNQIGEGEKSIFNLGDGKSETFIKASSAASQAHPSSPPQFELDLRQLHREPEENTIARCQPPRTGEISKNKKRIISKVADEIAVREG